MADLDGELWAAMRLLPGRTMRTFYSLYYHGYEVSEIAVAHNVSEWKIYRQLSKGRKIIENYFENVAKFGVSQTLIVMKAKNGKVDRGNGQRPDDQKRPVSIDLPVAPSQNPKPDIYYESPEREEFLRELSVCCSSAVSQVGPGASGYADLLVFRRRNLDAMRKRESAVNRIGVSAA